jgi:Domain of unknown function (DUF4349)
MKTQFLVLIFAFGMILTSCNSKSKKGQDFENVTAVASEMAPNELINECRFTPPDIIQDEEMSKNAAEDIKLCADKSLTRGPKKIIKDGSITLKINDVNEAKKAMDSIVKKFNGYYASENLKNNDKSMTYDLKIRVPAGNFEKLISTLENGTAEIISKNINSRDITGEYFDNETRLKSKQEYLKKYKELLAKASTIRDILAIETSIRQIQEEIESKQGRLNYLSDQYTYSTLNIILRKEKEPIKKANFQGKFSERVGQSLSKGWTSVVDFVLWIISIWPYAIFATIGFLGIRLIIKKRKSKQP